MRLSMCLTMRLSMRLKQLASVSVILSSLLTASHVVADDHQPSTWDKLTEPAFGLWSLGAVSKNSPYHDVDNSVSPAVLVFGGYGDYLITLCVLDPEFGCEFCYDKWIKVLDNPETQFKDVKVIKKKRVGRAIGYSAIFIVVVGFAFGLAYFTRVKK